MTTTDSATADIVENAPNTDYGHWTLGSGNGTVTNFLPCGDWTCADVEAAVSAVNAFLGTNLQVLDCNDCMGPDGPTFSPSGSHEHPVYDATGKDIRKVILDHIANGVL